MARPKFKLPRVHLRWPVFTIDLRRPLDRLKFLVLLLGGLIVAAGLLAGGIRGYTFTESPQFCGTLCHSMQPQYVRWQASPHANVPCAECHVGSGFDAFVNSKVEGTRQLVDTITAQYDRPIKSPVQNLRPARETCETCHTPTSFKDNIIKTVQHYDSDAQSTPVDTTFILKMGGTNPATGVSKGIHWHIQSQVSYIAMDDQRQTIAWVGIKQPDGTVQQYFLRDLFTMGPTAEADFVQKAQAEGKVRVMDCIDCHNRAAHYIPYPEQAVDQAITDGLLPRNLPYIRSKAVELLKDSYPSESAALSSINQLKDYYNVFTASGVVSNQDVTKAVAEVDKLYSVTNFPEMNLDWKTNPNNAQHTPTLGCFRCHDDKHVYVDEQGREQTISASCNLCHTVPIVGRGTDTLIDTPVIVGDPPATHADFRWTIDHRYITDAQKQQCLNCHGQTFCNNGVCHNLNHPTDMLFSHPQQYQSQGGQVCYICHQNVFCSRCHPGGVLNNP